MVDFHELMTPAARRQSESMADEIERIYELSDRWLAADLVRMARKAKELEPDLYARAGTLENDLVSNIIPEIAARLGETRFKADERGGGVRGLQGWELRLRAGVCLESAGFSTVGRTADRPGVIEVLLHEPDNGNPVGIALYRVEPAHDADDDYCAITVREVARYRGHGDHAMWTPRLTQRLPEPSVAAAPGL